MGWAASLGIALLSAIVGLVGSGLVALLAVDWYRITSREGASGFFVVGMGLVGAFCGGAIGTVVSRLAAAGSAPGFWKALGVSLGVIVGILGVIAGAARLLADVPPEIEGESVWLQVEVRLPDGVPATQGPKPGKDALWLGSLRRFLSGSLGSRQGILFTGDARPVPGGREVTGFVEVFTGRGRPVLDVILDGARVSPYVLSLPGNPGPGQREWSDWLAVPRRDGNPPVEPLTYRYRLLKRSDPVRTEVIGPFEVDTIAHGIFSSDDRSRYRFSAFSTFRVRHRGRPVSLDTEGAEPPGQGAPKTGRGPGTARAVIAVTGPRPALLVAAGDRNSPGQIDLLVDDGGALRLTRVAPGGHEVVVHELTFDRVRLAAWRERLGVRGWVDRTGLDHEGLFLVEETAVLDTRTLAVYRFKVPDRIEAVPRVPPLGLSPDGRCLVRFGYAEGDRRRPVLLVTGFLAGTTYAVPVEAERTGVPDDGRLDRLDLEWLDRHFTWQRGGDGRDVLAAREGAPADR